jgi:hypothetical protein
MFVNKIHRISSGSLFITGLAPSSIKTEEYDRLEGINRINNIFISYLFPVQLGVVLV